MCTRNWMSLLLASVALTVAGIAGADTARLRLADGEGPHRQIPPPHKSILPSIHISRVKQWQGDEKQVRRSRA